MTRNNHSKSLYSTTSHSAINSHDENLPYLPDLSGLRDEEKRHILDVLLRDETLRNKHLARFMQLRREVAELEEKSQTNSTSICARCHAPFGFIFNTGDPCPKCGAKVCKQCRLMYNVHDNGWLCQLCCKQMQLMSYSGEWIYTQRSNLRKDSMTTSEVLRKSLSPQVSNRNSDAIVSSSDTETEDFNNRYSKHRSKQKHVNHLIVQNSVDEDKLKAIKQSSQKRPSQPISTQSNYQRLRYSSSNIPRTTSSDDVDSLCDQSTNYTGRTSSSSILTNTNEKYSEIQPSIPQSIESLTTLPNQIDRYDNNKHLNKQEVDCASVTSSEWGADSEKSETILQRRTASIKSKLSTAKKLTNSIHSLRENVHGIIKHDVSNSRTSLNSEQKIAKELSETISPKNADQQDNTNSRSSLTLNNSTNQLHESSNTLTSENPNLRTKSIPDSNQLTTYVAKKPDVYGSVGQLNALNSDDDDDDIDKTFERVKSTLPKRTQSYRDIRGSQMSINSVFSESKARYGLDISGTIELKLVYSKNTGALDITINKCTNLARAKRHQTSDPYVKIYLLPDRSKNSKRKTQTKKNTVDPVFEEKFRYHITKQEFETRVLWISVWSQAALGQNDFLGEIHIPLATCTLDQVEEYQLLAKKNKNDLLPNSQLSMDAGEIQFELTFIENSKSKELGILQVNHIEGKSIYYGKSNVDAICKGVLMPDNLKRKLPNVRKGPSPKWELPLRWEGVRRDNLKNTSIEISIWCQERFKKTMLGFIRLNLALGHFDNKPVKWSDATTTEKSAWETFLKKPTEIHHIRLPLRPGLVEK